MRKQISEVVELFKKAVANNQQTSDKKLLNLVNI